MSSRHNPSHPEPQRLPPRRQRDPSNQEEIPARQAPPRKPDGEGPRQRKR